MKYAVPVVGVILLAVGLFLPHADKIDYAAVGEWFNFQEFDQESFCAVLIEETEDQSPALARVIFSEKVDPFREKNELQILDPSKPQGAGVQQWALEAAKEKIATNKLPVLVIRSGGRITLESVPIDKDGTKLAALLEKYK